ncbi:GNAT family N-acetyltransferase [Streptomyces phytophilus]|uniref:GNAT family N-acetyltransferase n=1 Tax=Streptomyces phytophilus TaxID=722715 RepID=UPI0015F06000|nr:GNAT family N-acetyltransferase [Streptomyces phytophilus]
MLLDVHDDCYADQQHDPFNTRERFAEFVDHWSSRPGWTCVVGYDDGEPVGYAYGASLTPGREWWRGHLEPKPEPERSSTFGVSEVMVRPKWRKTGISRRLHDSLLEGRPEALTTLSVDRDHPKVQALYESWGYRKVGEDKPFEDSPTFSIMVSERRRT